MKVWRKDIWMNLTLVVQWVLLQVTTVVSMKTFPKTQIPIIQQDLIQQSNELINNQVDIMISKIIETGVSYDMIRKLKGKDKDFSELNQILSSISFNLDNIPDITILGGVITARIDSVYCDNISIEDFELSHSKYSENEVQLNLSIDGLAFFCEVDWSIFSFLWNGEGIASVETTQNSVDFQYSFVSQDFREQPPLGIVRTGCDANIQIDDIAINGTELLETVDQFDVYLRDPIENQLEKTICPEDVENDFLGQMLASLITKIDTYLESFRGDIPQELQNPLGPENDLNPPSDASLTGFSSTSGQNFKALLDRINNLVSGVVEDLESPTRTMRDLAINQILRTYVLDEERALVVDGSMFGSLLKSEKFVNSDLSINKIKILGLDTLTEFVPLTDIGEFTVSSSIEWALLEIDIVLDVTVTPLEEANSLIDGNFADVNEEVTLKIGMKDIDFDFAIMFAADLKDLTSSPVVSLTDLEQFVACLSDRVFEIEISNLMLTLDDVEPPSLDGLISVGIDDLISSTSLLVFELYEGTVLSMMPYLFQVVLRKSLNSIIDSAMSTDVSCGYDIGNTVKDLEEISLNIPDLLLPPEEAINYGGSGDAPYGSTISMLYNTFLNQIKAGVIEVPNFTRKSFRRSLDQKDEDSIFFDSLIDLEMNLLFGEQKLDLWLKLYDVSIDNYMSLGSPFEPLRPTEAHKVESSLKIGSGGETFRTTTNVMYKILAEGNDAIQNDLEISLGFNDLAFQMAMFLSIVDSRLLNMPLKNIANIQCLLSTFSTPKLTSTGEGVGKPLTFLDTISLESKMFDASIRCNSCLSKGTQVLINYLEDLFQNSDLTEIFNTGSELALGLMKSEGIQKTIDRALAEAPLQCPSNINFDENFQRQQYEKQFSTIPPPENNYIITFCVVLGTLILLVLSFALCMKRNKRKQYLIWRESLCEQQEMSLKMKKRIVQLNDEELNSCTKSLFHSAEIPLLVRYAIPLVTLGNIGLFMSGHLSLGAQVDVVLKLVDDTMILKRLFDFTLLESIKDMWDSGAKSLAIILSIFSGLWPYIKQGLSLYLWFVSPTKVSTKKRESSLLLLDSLGKWSFLDIFVLFLSLVGFRVALQSPKLIPVDLYSIDILVIPKWGLYANLLAQLVSQITSHFIIHYHRTVVRSYLKRNVYQIECYYEEMRENSYTLSKHDFRTLNGDKEKVGSSVNTTIIIGTIVTVILFLTGIFLDSFSIESFGLLGVLIEVGQDFKDAVKYFSFFDVLNTILDQAVFTGAMSDLVGLTTLSIAMVWTVLAAPTLQLLLLLARWYIPMSKTAMRWNFVAVETIMAWQYTEVFILSIVVGAWQLGTVSEYMINDYCVALTDIFHFAVEAGLLTGVDGQCFRADATVRIGTWFLFGGAIGLTTLTHFVRSAAQQQEREIEVDGLFKKYNSQLFENDVNAIEIDEPPLAFTDFYHWLLYREQRVYDQTFHEQVQHTSFHEYEYENQSKSNKNSDQISSTTVGETAKANKTCEDNDFDLSNQNMFFDFEDEDDSLLSTRVSTEKEDGMLGVSEVVTDFNHDMLSPKQNELQQSFNYVDK